MKTIIRPAIIALALLGTIPAASAAPEYDPDDYPTYDVNGYQPLAHELAFWAQFNN